MTRLDAIVFRVVSARYSVLDPLGATRHGGRCNPRGLPTLYFSTTVPGALSESLGASDLRSVGPFRPRLLASVRVCLSDVVDLRDQTSLDALGIVPEALSEAWCDALVPTALQSAGARLAARGVRGVIYPSVMREDSANLAVFVGNLGEGDMLEVPEK